MAMKKLIIILVILAVIGGRPALAQQCPNPCCAAAENREGAGRKPRFIASYDHYFAASYGPNYSDAWGFTLGAEFDVIGDLKLQALYKHITDVEFKEPRDPKGAWGELRGHIPMVALKYDLSYGRVKFYPMVGFGYGIWDFRENPWLQDRNIKVEVENSIVMEPMLGMSVDIGRGWTLSGQAGWFDTNIGKNISANEYGIENILDAGDNIGLQFYPASAVIEVETKF